MAQQKPPLQVNPTRDPSFWGGMFKQVRLVWLLLQDKRVPVWLKSIPALALIYLISPIDFIPGALFPIVGNLDDIGVILLGMALFVRMCPPNLVEYYQNMLEYGSDKDTTEAVDTTYRVLDDDDDDYNQAGR